MFLGGCPQGFSHKIGPNTLGKSDTFIPRLIRRRFLEFKVTTEVYVRESSVLLVVHFTVMSMIST